MSQLQGKINGFVAGNKIEIRRNIGNLIAPLDFVYLTVKERKSDADVDALIQKRITVTLDDNVGQIVEPGDVSTPATVVFVLLPDDTADLWQRIYHYDIKAFDTDGNPYSPELGVIYAKRPVTLATS